MGKVPIKYVNTDLALTEHIHMNTLMFHLTAEKHTLYLTLWCTEQGCTKCLCSEIPNVEQNFINPSTT